MVKNDGVPFLATNVCTKASITVRSFFLVLFGTHILGMFNLPPIERNCSHKYWALCVVLGSVGYKEGSRSRNGFSQPRYIWYIDNAWTIDIPVGLPFRMFVIIKCNRLANCSVPTSIIDNPPKRNGPWQTALMVLQLSPRQLMNAPMNGLWICLHSAIVNVVIGRQ